MANKEHVEFISYTGKYPNLCSGVLTLKIDGEEVRFGHDYRKPESWRTDGNYEEFWVSGGSVWFSSDWSDAGVEHGGWSIKEYNIPEKYRKYFHEIAMVFNENVPSGCCGGCI